MTIFSTMDYKKYIRTQVEANAEEYGYKSKLADAAGCQKSFFSQVLNSHVQLTPEHALGLSKFWKLNPKEREYFLELVNFARAGTKELSDYIKEKLQALRKENENLGKRFAQPQLSVTDDLGAVYYSNWHYMAIHMGVTVPQWQNAGKLAKRLQLPEAFVVESLKQLQNLELVEKTSDGSWRVTKKSLHLPKDSIFSFINNNNWRQRVQNLSVQRDSDNIHYTGIYSLSLEDLERLRHLVLEFIDKTRKLVVPSAEEEIVCFACDLFLP